MTIREGENELALRQRVEVESLLADAPFVDGKGRMFDHGQASSVVMLVVVESVQPLDYIILLIRNKSYC